VKSDDRLIQLKAHATTVYRDWIAAHRGQEKTPETEGDLFVTMIVSILLAGVTHSADLPAVPPDCPMVTESAAASV
jgi:hypothetical protein